MKLQNFAVIFIVIILPIAIVLSEYTGNLITVANKQASYDAVLLNSTYDSVRAYQMNTLNNNYDEANNSKVRDINASVNSFFNSLAVGLSSSGFGKQELRDYIPAMLYTLYDGYYVYGAFDNVVNGFSSTGPNYNTSQNFSNKEYGLKPYIYYSCEYAKENQYDLIVNYTLDNYITVTGTYNDGTKWKDIALSGYYIDYEDIKVPTNGNEPANFSSKNVILPGGIEIKPEMLKEKIIAYDVKASVNRSGLNKRTDYTNNKIEGEYNYILYNNVKYYLDTGRTNGGNPSGPSMDGDVNISFNMTYDGYPIFFLDGDKRTYISRNTFDELKSFLGVANDKDMYNTNYFKDVNAYYYYYRAVKFSNEVSPILSQIDLGKATITDETGQSVQVIASNLPYKDNDDKNSLDEKNVIKTDTYHIKYISKNNGEEMETHIKSTYDTSKVFELSAANNPELESSSFNRHRMDVIISSIESSLVNTITNFNDYLGGTYNYEMPVLTEENWSRICNNVTVVAFMQGITIGNYKYYSNYSVVANTKVKEFISKDTIYVQNNGVSGVDYHDPRCIDYNNTSKTASSGTIIGYRNLDFDRKECDVPNGLGTGSDKFYYYPQQNTAAYECVVGLNRNVYTSDELLSNELTEEHKNKGISQPSQEVRRAYITALAREKGNGYKTYAFLNAEL